MKIDMRGVAALAVMALQAGCGGGGSGGGADPADGKNGARALASMEPPGLNCPAGGARLDSGIDLNGNGILDASEIVSTQYVCNGNPGAAGTPGLAGLAGAPGAAGTSGLKTLVQMSPEPAGAHCAIGGTKVSAGADANANGTLDGAEATSIAYVCDGATGAAGTNGVTGAAGADGRDVLMTIAAAGTSVTCPAGGSRIQSGIDANRNGTLDIAEVTATSLLCNGSNGAAGSDGIGSLIAVVAEPAGVAHCAAGGSRITSGPDSNGNGLLDAGEVLSTAYICNGVAGANGATGTNGTNGFTTLTVSTPEGAGINCAAGGVMITSGIDTSRDGVLNDPAEVTARSYVCNGFGAWVEVTATAVAARSNTGYVASGTVNNIAVQVTVTLPTGPAVGDVVRISGAGAGGWKIAQNPLQSIVTSNLDVASIAKTWTDRGVNEDYRSVASSADGNRLVAVPYGGPIVVSPDAGLSWTQAGPTLGWTGVASSADGRRLVAVGYNHFIYLSTDYGANWSTRGNSTTWAAVASSADGRVLAAAPNGQISVSLDYGANWTSQGPSLNWNAIALSADGSRMVAADYGGTVYVSSDVGVTWVATSTPAAAWRAVTSSADGRRLVAVAEYLPIYTSDDFGVTWVPRETSRFWTGVTSSADGTRLIAVAGYDQNAAVSSLEYIYASSDQGQSWTQRGTAGTWSAAASSADGSQLTAVAAFAYIGIATSSPQRMLATTPGVNGSIVGRQ